MKPIFTRLVSVGIACFCMASVMGQEIMPVQSSVDEQFFQPQDEIELRADGSSDYFWPDSIEYYDSAGKRTYMDRYDIKNCKVSRDSLVNGKWVLGNPKDTDGYLLSYQKVRLYEDDEFKRFACPRISPTSWWNFLFSKEENFTYNTVYDKKDNLILVEVIQDTPYNGTDHYIEYHTTYNEKNNPVLIEEYWYKDLNRIMRYEYNADGYMTLFEVLQNNNGKLEIIKGYPRETAEFDEQGRPAEMREYVGNASADGWLMDFYRLFYYSDGNASIKKVETIAPAVYVNQNILYLQAVRNETITVYSTSGVKLLETNVQSGLNTITIANLPQGILIVKGSNGWTKKLIVK